MSNAVKVADALCLQPVGRWALFPAYKKSDEPPTKEELTRLYKWKGETPVSDSCADLIAALCPQV